MNKLTLEEKNIIINKGTEAPFSGEYDDHYFNGLFICRQCDLPLYRSMDKFKSGCGWPSFDDDLADSVVKQTDADGRRTEILCKNCSGHLGHIFNGEHLTKKNTRHCVNSLSIRFIKIEELIEKALVGNHAYSCIFVAGGCFWGIENFFEKEPGVLATAVGFSGGHTVNPSYSSVCQGNTGHTETVAIIFNNKLTSLITLYNLFFDIHDPSQINRQGPDTGDQYRSAIFYINEQQLHAAKQCIDTLKEKGVLVATELMPYSQFYFADEYHQKYFSKRKKAPTCHFRRSKD